jgi:hypothetical protein
VDGRVFNDDILIIMMISGEPVQGLAEYLMDSIFT